MSLGEFLHVAGTVAAENLPVAVGGGVAVVVLLVLFVISRRRQVAPVLVPPLPSAGAPASKKEEALTWSPPDQSFADRRGSVRREGGAVRVVLASPVFRNGLNDGYVVDRSTGGLRVVMQAALAPGSTAQIRAVNAPDTVGFVTVIVRSCRKTGDSYELGCEFEKTPPWNVLLLFG
jgi:hypothetical protein